MVVGASGRSDVRDRIADEQIVGTPDMTPEATEVAIKEVGLTEVEIPDCSGGKVYAEMPRAVFKKTGEPVPEEEAAAALDNGTAIDNPERQVWVTETALGTALNTSYFAEQVSTFAIAMGIAMVVIGIGLLVLTLGTLRPQLAGRERA